MNKTVIGKIANGGKDQKCRAKSLARIMQRFDGYGALGAALV
jgi:hypothetical protein